MKKAKKTQNSGDKNGHASSTMSGRFNRRTIIIAATILVFVIVAAIIGFSLFRSAVKTSDSVPTVSLTAEQQKIAKQSGQTLDPKIAATANAAKASGDNSAAVDVYTKAIAANTDKDEQVALYINKAVLQASTNDVAGAIASAKQAEAIAGETLGTTTLLASLYKQNGDNVNAAIYFRKAANLVVDPGDGSTVGDKQYYLDTAQQLEAAK